MPHLPDTLESLMNQTVSEFNILIIDDGSKDNSWEYLQSAQEGVLKNARHRVTILHQENLGLSGTLNRMLEMLGTGWMVRQDQDDIALPSRIERLQEAISKYPQAGMIYSHAAHWQRGSTKGNLLTTPSDETGLRSFLEKGYLPSICHPSIALRVEAALEQGGYRFNLSVEDYDLYWRMGLHYDAYMVPEPLLGYRMVANSMSDKGSRKQAINVLYVQYLLLSELWRKKSLPYEQVVAVLERMVDWRHVTFRRHMRTALVLFGNKQFGAFALEITKAFLASPTRFVARFVKKNGEIARIGIAPENFKRQQALLWPAQ
jgi:glycosyltransferase involved in cell wall biosynthesis